MTRPDSKGVALVTCLAPPELDEDQTPLLDALRGAGLRAEMLAWDDPSATPADFELCVLRSTWNYYRHPDAFHAWLDSAAAATRLANPLAVLRWNLHKRYLRELEESGLPIIPTVWLERDAAAELREVAQLRGWNDVVVKPAVSAGSFRTRRFRADKLDEGQAFLAALLRERDVLVQRTIRSVEAGSSVDAGGERSLVWIDGEFTHAVRKSPRFAGGQESVSAAPPPTEQERAIGERALSLVRSRHGELLYARVDLVTDDDGRPLISELELAEPSLFLLYDATALSRFARAIVRWSR